ncbi:hypothetical protein MRX96_019118 [Rhipicephalus microplus]
MSDRRLFSCHRRDHLTILLEDDCFHYPPPTSRFSHPPRHCKGMVASSHHSKGWCWHRHVFRRKCRLGGVSHPSLRSATEEACGIYRHCTGGRENAGLGRGSRLRPAFHRSSGPATAKAWEVDR